MKCKKPYGFCIKFNLEEAKKLLREWWTTDFDIEINTFNDKNPIIFGLDNNSYWSNGNWYFSCKRILAKPAKEYMTKAFAEFMEEDFGREFTLDEAIEYLEDFYFGCL